MNDFTFDPKKHVYTLDGKPLQGVTSVLSIIAKPALIQWAANETVKWIEENCDVGFTDEELVPPFLVYPLELKEAAKAHTRKKDKAATQGTDTHAQIEEIVKMAIKENKGFIHDNWIANDGDNALSSFMKWAQENNVKFIESEKRMYSREWWVAGTTDLVFEKDGQRFVGDVKTMKKLWDRTPFFQCAAYMKMLKETDPNEYHGSCIINIPKETNQVETYYSFDWKADVKAFEAALTLYRSINLS